MIEAAGLEVESVDAAHDRRRAPVRGPRATGDGSCVSLAGDIGASLAARKKSAPRARGLAVLELEVELDLESLVRRLTPRPGQRGDGAGFDRAVLWDTRSSETLDGELTLGLGSAAEVLAPSLGAARAQVAALFEAVKVSAGAPASRLRAFGGAAFDDRPLGPFAALGRARLVVPRWTLSAQPGKKTRVLLAVTPEDARELQRAILEAHALEAPALARAGQPPRLSSRVADDGAAAFLHLAQEASRSVEAGELEKVVVARCARVEGADDPGDVLSRLAGFAGCVRFALATTDATFLGATPEVLVAQGDAGVRTEAVAGSELRRGRDLTEVARLLMRDKDRREHALVVEMIRSDLERAGASVGARESARVRTLPHLHHLVTPIAAHAPGAHVLDLALALHPTPAMGGVPKSDAAAFLAAHESIERGWYAAPFGWCDARGHGAFVVGIRSALLLRDQRLGSTAGPASCAARCPSSSWPRPRPSSARC